MCGFVSGFQPSAGSMGILAVLMALGVFVAAIFHFKREFKTSRGGKLQASADVHSWLANELVGEHARYISSTSPFHRCFMRI